MCLMERLRSCLDMPVMYKRVHDVIASCDLRLMDTLILLGFAILGAMLASVLACVPALHVYNVAGLAIVAGARLAGMIPSGEALAMFLLGMVTGYATLNTVPSIFFSAPDDSTAFVVLPGQKYLMQGRGYEATVLTGVGGLGGLLAVVAFSPLASSVFPTLRAIVSPHLGWILAAVIGFMLMYASQMCVLFVDSK